MLPIDLPTPLLLVLGGLAFLSLATPFLKILLPQRVDLPYTKRNSLFSPAELRFLKALELAVDDSVSIYGKVRIEDIVSVTGVSGKRRLAARNRISSRHVDYVLCDADTGEFLSAVELDDRSHRTAKAKRIDGFKNDCFAAAGLPLIRLPAASSYSVEDIRLQLGAASGYPIRDHSDICHVASSPTAAN